MHHTPPPALEMEIAQVGGRQRLDEVFLHAARRGDEDVDHLILHEELELLTDARRDEVRGEAEEDLAPLLGAKRQVLLVVVLVLLHRLIREAPRQHLIHLLHRLPKRGGLEPRGRSSLTTTAVYEMRCEQTDV